MSENDWRERLRAIADPRDAEKENPLESAIQEFAAELNRVSPWVQADLVPGGHPQLRSFVTGPKTRRDIRNVMLSFWIGPDRVRSTGDKRELKSREEVFVYLSEFATDSAFPRAIEEYKAICNANTPGELHGTTTDRKPFLFPVQVPPSAQRQMADRWRSHATDALDVEAQLEGEEVADTRSAYIRGLDVLAAQTIATIDRLESGGYTMSVLKWQMDGSRILAHVRLPGR